jgi:hypothetical protein
MNISSHVFHSNQEIISNVSPVVEIIEELIGGGEGDIVEEFEEALKDFEQGEEEAAIEEETKSNFLIAKIRKLLKI